MLPNDSTSVLKVLPGKIDIKRHSHIMLFLAHRIRISKILPWDRKSYLTQAKISYPGCHVRATYIGCIGTHANGHQVMSLLYLVTSSCKNAS